MTSENFTSKPNCFIITPFENCDEEWDFVSQAAFECDLEPVRGDRAEEPGIILRQILREIRSSSIAVAILTDKQHGAGLPSEINLNVVYELGIAHQILGDERVVILIREGKECFYDIQSCRYLTYTPNLLKDKLFQESFKRFLREAKRVHAEEESWNVVRSPLARTRMIVNQLEFMIQREEHDSKMSDLVIRTISGLGSLSISNKEPDDPRYETEYTKQLRLERDKLREALSQGAKLKSIIMPPRKIGSEELSDRLKRRYERLIALLEGGSDFPVGSENAELDQLAIKNCEFVLSPIPSPNLMILGDKIAYEGFKRGGSAGFSRTHCETNPDVIKEMISQFDQHFNQSQSDMARREASDGDLLNLIKNCYVQALGSSSYP